MRITYIPVWFLSTPVLLGSYSTCPQLFMGAVGVGMHYFSTLQIRDLSMALTRLANSCPLLGYSEIKKPKGHFFSDYLVKPQMEMAHSTHADTHKNSGSHTHTHSCTKKLL